MKKILFTVLFMIVGIVLFAQRPTAPRDTIVGREVTYHYITSWVDPYDSLNFPENYFHTLTCSPEFPGYGHIAGWPRVEYAERHEIDSTLSIIGIATCPYVWMDFDSSEVSDTDWTHAFEYLRLYEHDGDTMRLLASERFDMVDTDRWMNYGTEIRYDENNHSYICPKIVPVIERYFDKPVLVRDSFYVACTFRSLQDRNQVGKMYNYPIEYCMGRPESISFRNPKIGLYFAERSTEDTRIPDWRFFHEYFRPACLFAIFDTTGMGLGPNCGMVSHLRQGSVWDNNTMLMWDSTAGQTAWQLAVGFAEQDSESYRVYDLTTPSKALYNLEYNTPYAARVRAKCEGNNNYSQWSDTIQFVITRQPINIATVVDQYTHLLPNPARDRVTVISSFPLLHVDVYSLDGRRMLSQDCNGVSATLDIAGWAAGSYIVLVRTPAGPTAQKLTVGE